MEHEDTCSTDGCEKSVHSRGLCQAHYRAARRREIDPDVGTRKPGPKPTRTTPAARVKYPDPTPARPAPVKAHHRRMTEQEKADRRAARKAAKTHCVHGHALTPENTYTTASGQKICRLCQRKAQQMHHGRSVTPDTVPIGLRGADKTHCPAGHEYASWGRKRADGARFCTICHRANRVRYHYGLNVEQWDALVLRAQGRCEICLVVLREPHIDHDHADGRVRGLLCTSCNNGLGRFDDDPARLEAAAAYLRGRI